MKKIELTKFKIYKSQSTDLPSFDEENLKIAKWVVFNVNEY